MLPISTLVAQRYEIAEILTQKAGCSTFIAKDLKLNQLVVIKILEFTSSFRWDDLKLFEREAQTLRNLNHTSIPKYLDYFEIDTSDIQGFALVQTYIDAISLEEHIQRGRKFTEVELIELAKKILEILSYLHEQLPPVIHRDLKPSNILLSNRSGNSLGDIFLVDFGSVQTVASKETGTITIIGSYGYIPLEQFGGQARQSSDLYSLGMTIIRLITGIHPAELLNENGLINLDSLEISQCFKKYLSKLIEHNLEKRFSSSRSALNALDFTEQREGEFLHLKPASSLMQLDLTTDMMTIRYPKKESQSFSIFLSIAFIMIILTLLASIPAFISMLFFCAILFLIFRKDLVTSKQKVIFITKKNSSSMIGVIEFAWDHLNGEISREKTIKISTSDFFAYNSGYTFNEYVDSKGVKQKVNGSVTIAPSLSLYLSETAYRPEMIYEVYNQGLSKAELLWLGNEICNFLDLDLQNIYPTPKIPPAPECGCGC